MHTQFRKMTVIAVASALPLAFAAPGMAETHKSGDASAKHTSQKAMDRGSQKSWEQSQSEWKSMREKVVRADEIMAGDVSNGFNMIGNVRDLILSEDGSSVEYVLYDIPYPWNFYGAQEGFVKVDNVAFEPSYDGDLSVRLDEGEEPGAKEELDLTRGQADHRMVSNILGSELQFSAEGNKTRVVEDLLINRKTGEVTHYVVQMNPDSLFNDEPRAIPSAKVDVGERGAVSTDMTLAAVESEQGYAPEFLK